MGQGFGVHGVNGFRVGFWAFWAEFLGVRGVGPGFRVSVESLWISVGCPGKGPLARQGRVSRVQVGREGSKFWVWVCSWSLTGLGWDSYFRSLSEFPGFYNASLIS